MASQTRINRQRLINQATPDTNINDLLKTNPKLHQAIKNLGNASQDLTNSVFPALPTHPYYSRVISGGIQVVGADLLIHRHRIVLPIDPSGYYQCNSITLTSCTTSLKIASASGPFVADILVSQIHGTTSYKDLFQAGNRPTIPQSFFTAHNVLFAINTLYDEDVMRFDVITADGTASGLEILLGGHYNWSEVPVK